MRAVFMALVFGPCSLVISDINTTMDVCTRNTHWGLHDTQDFDACSLQLIYQSREKKMVRKLPKLVDGFGQNPQWDEPIQFWLSFWKKKGYSIPIDDPLLIKAMIAVESSFETGAESYHPESSAFGLMQITNQTRRILSGVPNPSGFTEIHRHRIHVSREDLSDGNINIAVGIRWLAHKYENLPYKSQFHLLKWYHSWDEHGEEYSRKVLSLYQQSKPHRVSRRLSTSSTHLL